MIIYFSAPNDTRPTPRYEKYYRLLSERIQEAEIIEACEEFAEHLPRSAWLPRFESILERIDLFVFIRNEEKCVGKGTLAEILTALHAGKSIRMAVTNEHEELILFNWNEIHFEIQKKSKRNYARFLGVHNHPQHEGKTDETLKKVEVTVEDDDSGNTPQITKTAESLQVAQATTSACAGNALALAG
jgi:hypothetical protein